MSSANTVKSIAVTGGAGFVGTHLLRALADDPQTARIFVLDLQAPQVAHSKIIHLPCDIRTPITLAPPEPVDLCIHLAAVCREPGFEWDEYFAGNYLGTRNVCAWLSAHDIRSLVLASTAMVFRAAEARRAENDLPNADTAYGISKALSEEVAQGWQGASSGRRLRIVRPGVVFGCGGGGNFAKLYKALRRNMFFYIGRDDTVKSAIYVKDLVRLLQFVCSDRAAHLIYHGVYPEPTTIRSVCEAMCSAFGWRRKPLTVPYAAALLAAVLFQGLDAIGVRNPVHYRRIQKLYYSTNLSSANLADAGFRLTYTLEQALQDWKNDCGEKALY